MNYILYEDLEAIEFFMEGENYFHRLQNFS